MRPLTIKEQEKHAQLLDKFVRKIQEKILSHKLFSDYEIHLREVGYGIKVDDQYVYFDFPFNENVPVLNNKLSHDPYLKDVDNSIHQRYFQLQENCRENCEYDGFIYYKYYFDEKSQVYHLLQHSNNLGIEERDENYLKFLPVMDCAVSPERTTYENTVKIEDEHPSNVEVKEILVLSKRVGKEDVADSQRPVYTDEDNMLLCTFELKGKNDLNFSTLVKGLYGDVFFFLETYFHSPILEKIMLDKRKSYILGYKHNIHGCFEPLAFENIKTYAEKGALDDILRIANQNHLKAKQLKLIHSLMFDYEILNAGFSEYNFTFRNKSISEILQFFENEINEYNIKTTYSKKSDFNPALQRNDGTYELFDLCLILWNLWNNACHSANDCCDDTIKIELKEEEDSFHVSMVNLGCMPENYILFLKGEKPYPVEFNPNNPYRGLEIVRDVIKENPNLGLNVIQNEASNTTNITIIIKNENLNH